MAKNDRLIIPPRNPELEQEILGTIFLSPKLLPEVQNILTEDCFLEDVHRRIYAKCIDLREQDLTVSPVSLRHFFDGETIGEITVPEYLARLTASAGHPGMVLKSASLLKELAVRRHFMWACESGIVAAEDNDARTAELIDETVAGLSAIRSSLSTGRDDSVNAGTSALSALASAKTRQNNGQKISGISTGLSDLDETVGGFQAGHLYIVGGRPSMGKTTVVTGFSIAAAEREGCGVLIISAEMTAEQLSERFLCDLTYDIDKPIQYNRISNFRVSGDETRRLELAAQSLADYPIEIYQKSAPTISEVRSAAYMHKTQFERDGSSLGLVIVDYLGLLKPTNRYSGNRVYETGEITAGLKSLAKELHVPVICLSQLARKVEERDDKRPILSDLRSSGDVEQDADTVIFLYRDFYYLDRGRPGKGEDALTFSDRKEASKRSIELIVAKNRHGPVKTVHAYCDVGSSVVRDAGFDSKPNDQGFDL